LGLGPERHSRVIEACADYVITSESLAQREVYTDILTDAIIDEGKDTDPFELWRRIDREINKARARRKAH